VHTVGEELKRGRERLGLSAEQIEARTKVQLYKIEALENGTFERLPQGIYLDGIVRSYANEVGVDPEPLIERVREERATAAQGWMTSSGGGDPLFAREETAGRSSGLRRDRITESPPIQPGTVSTLTVHTEQLPRRHRYNPSSFVLPLFALLASAGWSAYFYEVASRPDRDRAPAASAPLPARSDDAVTERPAAPDVVATPPSRNQPTPADADASAVQRGSSGTAGTSVPDAPAPAAPAAVSPSPAAPVRDLSGHWSLNTSVQTSSVADFVGLRLGYDVQLEQAGNRLTGRGRKVTENGRAIALQSQTAISMAGSISGGRVTLTLTEEGAQRQSHGKFVLLVDESGALRGRFSSTAAQSSGMVEGHRVDKP
jgi:transcriptional regulator with XRE-family HTH domain